MFKSNARSFRLDKHVQSARHGRRPPRRTSLQIELLEDRLMLANGDGFPDVISVGRVLSSWSAADVQNSELKITYSVYNQQPSDVSGVLLTTTLEPGVRFVTASQLPDRNGQELAWSLGTLPAFGGASVEVTVSLANPIPLALDDGAEAFGTVDAAAVHDDAPVARLRRESIDPELLRSTPDANTTDPFILAKAAELDQDVLNIFDFLRDEIGYESYVGSLRGARGTLWSSAGNALDEASLGIALLRASGIPARYVQGTLPDALAQQLILSMFGPSFQTVDFIPAGTEVADPANEPKLLDETRQHFWVQFDAADGNGAVFTDADPTFASAQIGQTFTAPQGTFTEVADSLRHKTVIRLNAEILSTASNLFGGLGGGPVASTVLDKTFNTAELVGLPLSLGNFVNGQVLNALFSATTFSYTPYLRLGDGRTPGDDNIFTGSVYQEVYTNFPFGSQVLTGLFLDVSFVSPQTNGQLLTATTSKTLFDRIGFAGRRSGSPEPLSTGGTPRAALSMLDLVTLQVSAETQSIAPLSAQSTLVRNLSSEDTQLASVLHQSDPAVLASSIQQLNNVTRDNLTAINSLIGTTFLTESDLATSGMAGPLFSRVYFDSPRLVAVSSSLMFDDATQQGKLKTNIDILEDSPRVVVAPNQAAVMDPTFHFVHGFSDSVIEGRVLNPSQRQSGVEPVSAVNTMVTALAQNPGIALGQENISQLDSLRLSSEAKARITAAVAAGRVVFVPAAPVTVNGSLTIAWLEIDSTTGDAIAVAEDGTHQAIVQYAASEEIAANQIVAAELAGTEVAAVTAAEIAADEGGILAIEVAEARLGQGVAKELVKKAALDALFDYMVSVNKAIIDEAGPGGILSALIFEKFKPAFQARLDVLAKLVRAEPPLADIVVGTTSLPALDSTATGQIASVGTVPPGSVSGSANLPSIHLHGDSSSVWTTTATSGFAVQTLTSGSASVANANGQVIGSGTVAVSLARATDASVSGTDQYSLVGNGSLSFYGPAETSLGVSGNWTSYSANVTGNVTIRLTTDGIALNGQALAAGTYTITTAAATLTGSGATSSPNFSGSVSVTVTSATVDLGPTSGNVSVGGSTLPLASGATLSGYTGTLGVSADGNGTVAVALSGSAIQVLTASANPTALTTNQNTLESFQVNVRTSLTDTYTVTAQAPRGWQVAIDNAGNASVTPAPGLQSGTFPVKVVVQSTGQPELVAQTIVQFTISPTLPGISLNVATDPLITVPFKGALVPTAFEAIVQNLGPAADTFNLSFPNISSGFTLLNSATSFTVPAGQSGVTGLYLEPDLSQPLSPQGTQVSFAVTATSTTDSSITKTQLVTFTMPAIDAVTIVGSPPAVTTTPGTGVTDTLTVTNVGNVPETVNLTGMTSSGFALSGLIPVTLGVGQSVTQTITLTPSGAIPLNTTLSATITATFGPGGSTITQTLPIQIRVAVPGADAIARAAGAASELGNTALAQRLNDLSIALTNLVQSPTSDVFKSQALASLDSILTQLVVDPILAAFVDPVSAAKRQLAAAGSPAEIQAAVSNLGNVLDSFARTVTDLSRHNFESFLLPNSQIAQPQTPATFELRLHNIGFETTTYNVSLSGLPAGVSSMLSQNSVMLDRDQFASVMVTITENSAAELTAFDFGVNVVAAGFPEVVRTIHGALTTRKEIVSVVAVAANPPFTDAGGMVDVSTRVLNAVNREQQAMASFVVKDSGGQVVFSSMPVPVTLGLVTSLVTFDLGSFDTTGRSDGDYTIEVTLKDSSGQPIPGATGSGTLLIGSPVTAELSVAPDVLPPGDATVMNSLQIDSRLAAVPPVTLIGQVSTPAGARGVALRGNFAYVCGGTGINVIDITDPTHPLLVRTIGSGNHIGCVIQGDLLLAMQITNDPFFLEVYSLKNDPANPNLLGSSGPIKYNLQTDLIATSTHAFVSQLQVCFTLFGHDIFVQPGDLLSIALNLNDPVNPTSASPALVKVLFNTHGDTSFDPTDLSGCPENGGDNNVWKLAQANANTLYLATTTIHDSDTQNGVGVVRVVDISDPDNPSVLRDLQIPGTVQTIGVAVDGTRGLAVSSSGGWTDFFLSDAQSLLLQGNIVFTTLDLTDPRNPQIIASQPIARKSRTFWTSTAALGNGLFAFSNFGGIAEMPQLLLINTSDPRHMIIGQTDVPPEIIGANGINSAGNLIFTTESENGAGGLFIYDFSQTQTLMTNVPGTSDPYLVGMPSGTTLRDGDAAPGQSPAQVFGLKVGAGTVLTFSAAGLVANDPGFTLVGPDGGGGFLNLGPFVSHAGGAENGISDVTARINSLVGVFLGPDQPDQSPAPAALDFSSTGNVLGGPDYLTLSPALKQVFFIGDGLTASGEVQRVFAPAGATRLFLGTMDAFSWANNIGSFDVTVHASAAGANTPVTARVRIPKNTGVAIVPGSFNVAPTEIISGPDFDTLKWDLALSSTNSSQTLTWRSMVSGMQSGESREVTVGSTIDFVSQNTPGELTLPPEFVVSEQVLSLDPASHTVRRGEATMYTVTIANPTMLGVTYDVSVAGVPLEWVDFPSQVTVPAGGSVNLDLTLTSDPFAPEASFGFVVAATPSPPTPLPGGGERGRGEGSVEGTLNLVGEPLLPDADPDSHGVVVAVSPMQVTAGQGSAAAFVARVTNTGSVTETFDLAATLSAGFTAMFEEPSVTLAPGAGNFRDVSLTLVASLGTPPGGYDFSVIAASTLQDGTSDIANSRVVIVGAGVHVSLNPASAAPGGTLQLRVTNTGQATGTFDLSLAGPAALAASLQSTFVTLAPNATQVIPILVSSTEYDFAIPGDLQLTATATSRSSPAVQDSAAANVTIAPAVGLDAEFTPNMVELPQPGVTTFLLMVENTGNTEDAYTATIMATSGPVSANLVGLDGQPAQTIPVFRLPGLATGAILVHTDLRSFGHGTVTVEVRSLTHGGMVSANTATVTSQAETCVANNQTRAAVNAGNVTARVDRGRLIIAGDRLLNNIRIEAGQEANSFCIVGTDGTTVNGDSDPALISGVTGAVMITMSGASDTVFFDGSTRPITLPGDLTIRMNSTRDTLRLDHVIVAGRTRIRTGRGRDLVELVDTVLTGKSSIVTGRGDDTLRVHDSQFLSDILLDGYTGTDSLDAGILGRPNSNGNLFARRLQIEFETLLS